MSRLLSIVGDSNVIRNLTALNIASREAMKTAQVIDCSLMTSFTVALAQVRAESTACIVSNLTEMLVIAGDCGTIFSTIDPILAEFSQKLSVFCTSRPDLKVSDHLFSS